MGSAVKPFTSCSWPLRRSPYTCFGGSSEAKQLRKAFYFIFSTYFLDISFNFHLICFEEIHYLNMSTLDLKYQISHRFVELFAAAHSAHIIFTQLLGVLHCTQPKHRRGQFYTRESCTDGPCNAVLLAIRLSLVLLSHKDHISFFFLLNTALSVRKKQVLLISIQRPKTFHK